jgi:integrase
MRIIIKRLGERAGIPDLSPHAFRRGGACALTLNGAPGRIVMGLAGWSSSRMLDIYTRGIKDSDLETAFRRYGVVGQIIKTQPQPTGSEP